MRTISSLHPNGYEAYGLSTMGIIRRGCLGVLVKLFAHLEKLATRSPGRNHKLNHNPFVFRN